MKELGQRINAHLLRLEADKKWNVRKDGKGSRLWNCGACASGKWIYITYVSYQGTRHVSRDDAEKYLAWLDAGHGGSHWQALGTL